MTDCVADASALLSALVVKTPAGGQLRARLAGSTCHAPHLIDAETGNILRRHELRGLLSADEAVSAFRAAGALIDYRYPHRGALGRLAWSLRHRLTFYDALYVALATHLGLPLLTADHRLARAPGISCRVEVV